MVDDESSDADESSDDDEKEKITIERTLRTGCLPWLSSCASSWLSPLYLSVSRDASSVPVHCDSPAPFDVPTASWPAGPRSWCIVESASWA